MKMTPLILAGFLACGIGLRISSAEDVDLQSLIQETQRMQQEPNRLRLIWWMPTEFWKESFKKNPNMTEEQKRQFYAAVDDYFVLAIVDAAITPLGTVNPQSREEIMSRLSLTIDGRKVMRPLPDAEVSAETRTLFAAARPIIANNLGQIGQGMQFVWFKGLDAEGNRLADPNKKGAITVALGSESYKFRLPLGSLLPAKYDPQSGEKFPGNYEFSPFTGKKLVLKPLSP